MTTDDTEAARGAADEQVTVPAVDDALEELYGLLRDDFIPRRDELAKQARAGGDRDTAAAIVRLRKPSAAAWLANMLAREHPDEIGALEDLGASMRDAQARLEGDALRRLSRQRHELVHALVERARRIAREEGVKVGDAVVRELERTVGAALADQEAARALTAGHLVTSLEPGAGLGAASASAPATSGPRPAAPRPARRRSPRYDRGPAAPAAATTPTGDEPSEPAPARATSGGRGDRDRADRDRAERERAERERAERERAERERAEREERERVERERLEGVLADARAEAGRADDAARGAREAADAAGAAVDDAAAATADLRERLAAAEQAERAARDHAAAAERDAAARGRDAEDASARVDRAERDLET